MRRLTLGAAIIFALAGCKKDTSSSLPTNRDAPGQRDGSALWKQAPAGVAIGVVIAPGVGSELHDAFIEVAGSMRKTLAGARMMSALLEEAREIGVDPMSPGGLTAVGFDLDRGMGLFQVSSGELYAILPVVNRAAFRAATGAVERGGLDSIPGLVCGPSGAVYRCASSADKLAAWASAPTPPDAGWPADLRGGIELLVTRPGRSMAELEAAVANSTAIRAGVKLERGGFIARFSISGRPTALLATGPAPLAATVMKRKPAGLMVASVRSLIDRFLNDAKGLDSPGPGGVTARQVFNSLSGEVVAYAPAGGSSRGYVELGITDRAPFDQLSKLCGVPLPISEIKLAKIPGGCRVTFRAPQFPRPISVPIQIGASSITATFGDAQAARTGARDAVPDYVTRHPWLTAVWLRGSLLLGVSTMLQGPAAELAQALDRIPELGLGLWGFAHLSEFGAGVRSDSRGLHGFVRLSTTWRNPPEVVAELEPLIEGFAGGKLDVGDRLATVAERHPDSPLAVNLALDTGGAASGAAVVGVLAAVAIPAFTKYIKKSKTTEARQFVKKIYDGARAYYLDRARHYPKGSTPVTPPLGSCCGQPDDKCAPDAKQWTHPTWVALQFSVDDPHYYSYQYVVAPDGQSFTARAFGDLDCDGQYSTFEMYGDKNAAGSAGLYRENELE